MANCDQRSRLADSRIQSYDHSIVSHSGSAEMRLRLHSRRRSTIRVNLLLAERSVPTTIEQRTRLRQISQAHTTQQYRDDCAQGITIIAMRLRFTALPVADCGIGRTHQWRPTVAQEHRAAERDIHSCR